MPIRWYMKKTARKKISFFLLLRMQADGKINEDKFPENEQYRLCSILKTEL